MKPNQFDDFEKNIWRNQRYFFNQSLFLEEKAFLILFDIFRIYKKKEKRID